MTHGTRWRILILQAGLIGVLAFVSIFAIGMGTFVRKQIGDQLTAQKISFPPAATAVAGGALDPAEFADLRQYAAQQVVNGDQARAYDDGFIGRHLQNVAGGKTYSEVSALAIASPTDQKLAGQVNTLFKGETLRGLLLNAYGWWTVGQYALYAGIGLAVAAIGVLGAMVFEIFAALRARETSRSLRPSASSRGWVRRAAARPASSGRPGATAHP